MTNVEETVDTMVEETLDDGDDEESIPITQDMDETSDFIDEEDSATTASNCPYNLRNRANINYKTMHKYGETPLSGMGYKPMSSLQRTLQIFEMIVISGKSWTTAFG